MRFVLIDFETESAADLKKAGAWCYAENPSTNIVCLGYSIDGGEPIIRAEEGLKCSPSNLLLAVIDTTVMFVAHNAFFEKCIWRNIMIPVYGWPDIPNERWHDIMAVAAMKALPLKLERAAMALRLPQQKDTGGTKITLSLSRTDKRGYYAK